MFPSKPALLAAFALLAAGPAAAQTRAPGEADPGVRPTRLIEDFVKQSDIAALSDVLKELAIVGVERSQSVQPSP